MVSIVTARPLTTYSSANSSIKTTAAITTGRVENLRPVVRFCCVLSMVSLLRESDGMGVSGFVRKFIYFLSHNTSALES